MGKTVMVTLRITETFEKRVIVAVPQEEFDKGAKRIVSWVRENTDAKVLEATSFAGTDDPGEDMDYKQEVEVC